MDTWNPLDIRYVLWQEYTFLPFQLQAWPFAMWSSYYKNCSETLVLTTYLYVHCATCFQITSEQ